MTIDELSKDEMVQAARLSLMPSVSRSSIITSMKFSLFNYVVSFCGVAAGSRANFCCLVLINLVFYSLLTSDEELETF